VIDVVQHIDPAYSIVDVLADEDKDKDKEKEKETMQMHSRFVLLLAALALVASPLTIAAQSSLPSTDAAAFLGAWTLGLDTPQGPMTMTLTLKDEGGKLAGSITADMMPDPQKITDISKNGDILVLAYTLDFQGQAIPAKIALVPDGEKWKAGFDFADGQFQVDGTAVKK
jgi:hypothetical protein